METILVAIAKFLAIFLMPIILTAVLVMQFLPKESVTVVETQQEPTVVAKPVDPKQLKCLADNIYFEAGAESTHGKAAVARVVMNRINHGFANTPCNVVYQTTTVTKIDEETLDIYKIKMCQFSWVCEDQKKINTNSFNYKKSLEVAHEVLAFDAHTDVVPKSALFFHNLSIDPSWPYKQVAKIGNHIFYSKQKTKPKSRASDA